MDLQRTESGRPTRRNKALGSSQARPSCQRAELKKILRPMAQPTGPNKTGLSPFPSPACTPPTPLLPSPPADPPFISKFQRSCDRWNLELFPLFFSLLFFLYKYYIFCLPFFYQISLLISYFLSQVHSIFSHIL